MRNSPCGVCARGVRRALLLASLVLACGSGHAQTNPFRNITNEPFASRCNGPQGAIVVADGGVESAAARRQALRSQADTGRLMHATATVRRLQRLGLHSPRSRVRLSRLVVHTRDGSLVQPDLVQAQQTGKALGAPGNQLRFEFQGWSEADRTSLETYLAVAYPKARLVYGPPAFNITVKIIQDSSVRDIQGGIYDATTNEIRMAPLSGNFAEDTFVLLQLVLRAFHDDAALFYDAWEEGFVGAAATAIQVQPGVSPLFDPKDPGPFYALSVYEPQNQPELGNSTFYPPSGFGGMLVWRIAMARAAWLKCWIEDENFFSRFNAAYYAEFSRTLPGDVPRLRELAEQALPTVEGLPFQEWFVRQHVLDTSVRSGLKLFTWNIPLKEAVVLVVEHYLTDPHGDEFPRGGQARTEYWNYDFTLSLYAEEGNLIQVDSTGETPGEGFLIPTFFNIGGPQRITVQVDLNGLRGMYPYPYGVRGFDPGENNLYGAVLNQASGRMNVTGGEGIGDLEVRRGVWGGRIVSGDLQPLKLTATFRNPDGQEVTRQFNVGWDSYMLLMDGGPQTTVTHVFARGSSGLHLMSLPVTPLVGSAPQVLGIPAGDLLLARWDPAAPPEGRYRIWPDCEPLALGRGFWLRVLQDVTTVVTGVRAAPDQRVSLSLQPGWNMFGPVRSEPVTVSDLKIQVGTDVPVLLAEAVQRRYVQAGIFGYDQAAGYSIVDTLQPFAGYWIRVLSPGGCQLVFEPTSAGTARKSAVRTSVGRCGSHAGPASSGQSTVPQPDWKLPVVVECGSVRSAAAYLGGARDATAAVDPVYDLEAPPTFGPTVTARFMQTRDGAERAFLTDVRALEGSGEAWELQVSSEVPGQPVRVSWPDLSQVPGGLRPVLYDPASGRRVYMRTSSGLVLPADSSGVRRRLRIEMLHGTTRSLAVTSMTARTEGNSLSVAYTLSRDASVGARVLNIAGRQVRQIARDRVQGAGLNTLSWNLRDERGLRVPNGLYLVEVEARAEDGQATRAVRTVRVVAP